MTDRKQLQPDNGQEFDHIKQAMQIQFTNVKVARKQLEIQTRNNVYTKQ